MAWTTEAKVSHLVGLPWTVDVLVVSQDEFVATIREFPFLVASGESEKAVSRNLYGALSTAIGAMLDYGDPIPAPRGELFPWDQRAEPPTRPEERLSEIVITDDGWRPTASAISQSLSLPA
jgi:predicted RNase H-like HicB family nuclease